MRNIITAAFAAGVLMVPLAAQAQDWWSGPEVGVQGGYAWGTSNGSGRDPGVAGGYHSSTDGGLGGGHIGFNSQFGQAVVGLEGDVEGADVHGNTHGSMDFDASIRAKLGWSFGQWLPYVTGGAAFGDVNATYFAQPSGVRVGSIDGFRAGWTAGAGIEYAITPNWEAGIEYRYTDLGHKAFYTSTFADQNEFNYNAIRLNITYRFAPPPPAPPPMAMPAAAPAAPPPMARTFLVFFDFDRYNLTPDARRVIESAAAAYKSGGSARIDVSGYTDLSGTQAYNLRLSQRRADAVVMYLVRQGVPKSVLDVKWFGKEHPRVPTPDGVREPQNRRVEIVMH